MSQIKLSILVPTVPRRLSTLFPSLMRELLGQCNNRPDVEIIGLFDNKKRTVGEKRQNLLDLANGEYVIFIDDDDRVALDYVSSIMGALYANPDCDCVVYDTLYKNLETGRILHCKYGIEFEYETSGEYWQGKPAHTMVYKKAITLEHKYNKMAYGEDYDWVKRACSSIKKQVRIDKVLYYYDFNPVNSETEFNMNGII